MTSPSSDTPDEQLEAELELAWHRELDRLLDMWDDEPTFQKLRKGGGSWS